MVQGRASRRAKGEGVIRLICKETDNNDCAAGIGDTRESFKTFDGDLAAMEAWLREPEAMNDHYTKRVCLGIEVIEDEPLPVRVEDYCGITDAILGGESTDIAAREVEIKRTDKR